jgi:hypothetical protein
MGYNHYEYPILLRGIQLGLAEGIPDIADQPWKVLEVAMKHIQPEYRAALYHDWQLLYKSKKPTKLQKKDLEVWGLNGN